jgi:hypothetical protein
VLTVIIVWGRRVRRRVALDGQARAESEASKAVERESKNREANALNVARNIQVVTTSIK